MFYHLCALALIVLVLCLAAVRRCSLYSPLVISASIWLVVFIAGLIFQERFYPLQENAFIAWLIWFMVTSLIFFLLYPSSVKSAWSGTEIRKIPLDYTLPLLLMIVWLGYRIWVVGSTGPDQFFSNLRMSAINLEGFTPLGLVARFYPLIFALFLFEHVYAHQENRHLRLLLWCLMLLYVVATMGKSQLLTLVLSWIIIQGIKGRMKIRMLVVLAAIVFALMMALHFTRASYESTIMDVLTIYIYSPIVALGYMDIDDLMPFGAYVFRFFYVVANYLGIAPLPVTTITPYVNVPELTNAYTVMQPFYHDFGLLSVSLQAVIYGLFFSCLYLLSVKRGRLGELGLVLFSGYSIFLVAQFIGDLLIMNFSGNLQFLIYAFVVFLASRKVCYVR
jgi:oligosaccharide repeat unit polymerase